MSMKIPLGRQDLMMLRPAGVVFALSLVLSGAGYGIVSYLNQNATRAAMNARSLYEQATQSVQQIAEEEATIVRYIDRYRDMEKEGIVSEEDRLTLLEKLGEIRQLNDLFPVSIEMGEQVSIPLQYDPNDLSPGDPVSLRSTRLSFRMQMLHEADLTRLLGGLLKNNGLIVPTSCAMRVNNFTTLSFTQLGELLGSECELRLFTYDLNPPVPDVEYF